jgi:hypothetical protein
MRARLAFVGTVAVLVIASGAHVNFVEGVQSGKIVAVAEFNEPSRLKAIMIFNSPPYVEPRAGAKCLFGLVTTEVAQGYKSTSLDGGRLGSKNNFSLLISDRYRKITKIILRTNCSIYVPRNALCGQIAGVADDDIAYGSIRTVNEWFNAARINAQIRPLNDSGVFFLGLRRFVGGIPQFIGGLDETESNVSQQQGENRDEPVRGVLQKSVVPFAFAFSSSLLFSLIVFSADGPASPC